MNEDFVITIGGPPGAGSTTVVRAICQKFGMRYFSTGKVFRDITIERGLSFPLFNETAEKEVDLEVDRRSKEEAAKGGIVIESKLAAWVNKDTLNKTVIKIWCTASLDTRASRVFGDPKKRVAESKESLEDVKNEIQRRWDGDKRRYKEYYTYDLDDMSIYDLIIETDLLTAEEVISKTVEYLKERGCEECTTQVELA